MSEQVVHYAPDTDQPPDETLCGIKGGKIAWKLADVTCIACEKKFSDSLWRLRNEMRLWGHRARA